MRIVTKERRSADLPVDWEVLVFQDLKTFDKVRPQREQAVVELNILRKGGACLVERSLPLVSGG